MIKLLINYLKGIKTNDYRKLSYIYNVINNYVNNIYIN